jgi:hypothetical protein
MKSPRFVTVAAIIALTLFGIADVGATSAAQEDPLEPFARLMGGTWYGEGSEHSFEWGVGKRSVTADSYFIGEDGEPTLVSQGLWYWDPEAGTIRGVTIAIEMPFEVMEMRSRFDDDMLINELRAIAADGTTDSYVETWTFNSDNQYSWTLYQGTLDGEVWMTDTYERR